MKRYAPYVYIILGIVLVVGAVLAFRKSSGTVTITNTAAATNTVTNNSGTNSSTNAPRTNTMNTSTGSAGYDAQLARLAASPTATIETDKGTFTIKFYTDEAPNLTKNFVELANKGYYGNLTFHRIVPGFVIQGGDPKGDGTGGESYTGSGLADELGALQLHHLRGAVAWAKSSLPNSIGSQFYIALDELEQLDGSYSVFGQVVTGMDVVDAIAAVPTDASDKPVTPVHIIKVTINE